MDAEALYTQLGRLIAEMPQLASTDFSPKPLVLDSNVHLWLGRAMALVEQTRDVSIIFSLKAAIDDLLRVAPYVTAQSLAARNAASEIIKNSLYRALARAELNAPSAARGAFIPVGSSFDAFAAISKVLGEATGDVLIVDPYMDEKVLTNFAPLAAEGVLIRLLADEKSHKASLPPAASSWVTQYGSKRPLEIRLAAARSLHDRVIVVDHTKAWTLTQSLNAFATRSPASIIKVDAETAGMKIAAYQDTWDTAKSIA